MIHMFDFTKTHYALTVSRCSSCSSLTTKIMSKRERIVGMKSMFSAPFVSSQRPNTLLAAASTEQREFKVVVMPAYSHRAHNSLLSYTTHSHIQQCTQVM